MSRQRYSEEFKIEALKQVTEKGDRSTGVITCDFSYRRKRCQR